MNDGGPRTTVEHYRIEARVLLKHFRRGTRAQAEAGAARFQHLDRFVGESTESLLADRNRVRLKDALAVIARERGYRYWTDLKWAVDAADQVDVPMYEAGFDVLLNAWFARYEDSHEALQRHGGYLLPYRDQFFVCEPEGIRMLGLDPTDPDWDRIGHDWVRPADREAFARLRRKRIDVLADRG